MKNHNKKKSKDKVASHDDLSEKERTVSPLKVLEVVESSQAPPPTQTDRRLIIMETL